VVCFKKKYIMRMENVSVIIVLQRHKSILPIIPIQSLGSDMKKFIKRLAITLAVISSPVVFLFVGGVVNGIQEKMTLDDAVADLNQFIVDESVHCGEIDDETVFNNTPVCQTICDSFFECRHNYLMAGDAVSDLYESLTEESYTDDEWINQYGPVEAAEVISPPGAAPKPNLN